MRLVLPLLFLALIPGLAVTAEPKRPRVLITTFEPFGGSPKNGSHETGLELVKRHGSKEIEYEICRLPVTYDWAAEVAQKCYAAMDPKPDLVLSTGEAPGCRVTMETRAHNYDADGEDSAGVNRSGSPILPGGPKHENFTYPMEEMFCAGHSMQLSTSTLLSSSPENYVCNNTAYLLNSFFRNEKRPYGFIHLPHNECKPKSFPEAADTLHRMAKAALKIENEKIAPATNEAEGCLVNEAGNMRELLELITDGQRAAAVACRLDMRRFRLRSNEEEGLPQGGGRGARPHYPDEEAVLSGPPALEDSTNLVNLPTPDGDGP